MMTFTDGGKHEWLATAATDGPLALKRITKIAEIVHTNHEGTHGTRDRQTATAQTTTARTRPANMVLSHPRQPPPLPCLLRGSTSGQPIIRAETPTRANQVPFELATDRATAVRHPRPVRRRHRRGHFLCFHKMLECLSLALHVAAQIVSVKSPRAPTSPDDDLHGVVPAVGTNAPSTPPPSQITSSTKGVRAHSDAPLDHGPSSAMGTSASEAVTPCRGSNSTIETRAPNAAPLNYDTGACTLHASPRHATRSKKTAATTHLPHTRAGSSSLISGRKAVVGLRCGKANPYTPRSLPRSDPVSPRGNSGRSILSLIKVNRRA